MDKEVTSVRGASNYADRNSKVNSLPSQYVKEVSERERGLNLVHMGESHGTCVKEKLERREAARRESLSIEETVCMKSVVRNWRDPTHHPEGKSV